MKKTIINKLEESVGNVDNLDYEKVKKILSKKNVINSLDKQYCNCNEMFYEDFDAISSNHAVMQIIYEYFRSKNIIVNRVGLISVSDLNEFLINYYQTISKFKSLSEEGIKDCLKARNDTGAFNSVINSYLKTVFMEVLKYSSDEVMFDELLTEGNNVLINCIVEYDDRVHGSFDDYFKFRLFDVLSSNSNLYKDSNIISFESSNLSYSDFQDNLVNYITMRDYAEEILKTSRLTAKEKLVLCYRFGLVDSNFYSPVDVASILGLPRNEELVIESGAIKKIKSLHKKNVDIFE